MGSKSTVIERIAHSRAPQIAVGLVLVLFVGVAWWRFSDASELAEMTVKRRAGVVTVVRAGEVIEVGDSASLKPRDVVETHSAGEAVVRLEGDRLLTLAPGSKIRIRDARAVESQSGSLLAKTSDALVVTFGGARATTPSATFRVDRGVSAARVASYAGRVTLSAPGEERLVVGPLFQASPSVNFMPQAATPYDFDSSDPWDRLHLEEVMALQEELDQLSGGLEAQIGRERPGLDYFAALEKGADVSFMKPYLKSRDPINLLVGFTIAAHDDARLAPAFRQAFSLYDRGAEWAVAAAIMRVDLGPVIADLEDIATVAVVAASGGNDSFTAAAAALAGSGQVVQQPGQNPVPTAPPGPSGAPPTKAPPPPPSATPNPPQECQSFGECTVQDVADELNPTSSPTPKPTDDPGDEGPLNILNGGKAGLID